jgi:glycosyltransferase involved in cell wall biosynthesis
MIKPRVLVVQPSVQPPGGGNGVCAWMLQALRDDYDVSLLTWKPVDLTSINAYFGTSLRDDDFKRLTISPWLRAAIDGLPVRAATLKASLLRRRVKSRAEGADLLISAHNEVDYGRPGVQYIHYPVRRVAALPIDLRWYHHHRLFAAYEWMWSLVSPFDDASMRSNLTLVNSAWTGQLVAAVHHIPVRVVHPPAPGSFPAVPWRERENGFLCIGRLSPEKRVEQVIEIVRQVRDTHPDAHLHIVGSDDHIEYARQVRRMAARAGSWVTVEGTLSMPAFERLVSSHRYFLHAMREEHFGMSVAQAVRAGCVPFVPEGGGQVEIVGDEPLLRYRSAEEAASAIVGVMANPELQQRLLARLASRAVHFGPERFMDDIRRAAAEMLARQRQTP